MAQTKATKKFEKRHLKDTLERRKGLKKVKQKQQLKAKQKSRRAEENGEASGTGKEEPREAKKSAKRAFQDMSVDDFFQGGFEVPEMPKRKASKRQRQEEDISDESDSSSGQELMAQRDDVGSDADSDDDSVDHQAQLDALAKDDPEFHKYLQENEPELLDSKFDPVQLGELSDDEEPRRKKVKKNGKVQEDSEGSDEDTASNELTKDTLKKWETALTTQHSLRAARETVLAFRSAVHVSDDDKQETKYAISNPQIYHQLVNLALTNIPAVFEHHLPVQESKNGKVHVPTENKKFKTIAPLFKSHMSSILHLLGHLSDAATLRLTLSSTLPLIPYLLSFKKIVRDLARAVTEVWSSHSNTEAARIAAFLLLRRLAIIGDPGIRENVLKATYQALVKGSRNITTHTIAGVNLMKNSASELWSIDTGVGYATAFSFIRQLAIHLRSSIQNNSKESYKNVYNWQYVHSLDFWSRVLSAQCAATDAPLRPLIYPLVQVTLGALRLIPTATYFPLRFQLVRSLLRLSRTTGTYIPLAAVLYEVLSSAEMRKAPKAATLKPLDFATVIRAPKAYLHTRTYQDGVGEQVQELFTEFFGLWCKSIAFPELSLAVVVMLKRWLKDVSDRRPGKGNKNQKVNGSITLLVQKLEANSNYIKERRDKVEFAPNDRKGVEAFLQDVAWEKTPLGAYLVGLRRTTTEKAKLIEQGRKDEEKRNERDRAEGRSNGVRTVVDDDDEDNEAEEDSE